MNHAHTGMLAVGLLLATPLACTLVLGDGYVVVAGSGGAGGGGTQPGGGGSGGVGGSYVGTACSAATQDCRDGLKCLPTDPQPGTCAENGTALEGEPCGAAHPNAGYDDCAAGLLCVEGRCSPLCDPNAATCGNGQSSCVYYPGDFGVCAPWCHPLFQDCPPEQGCYALAEGFVCAPLFQNLSEGEVCSYVNDCALGLVCASLPECGGNNCCTPFCDVNDPGTACVAGDVCYALGYAAPFDAVGVCANP